MNRNETGKTNVKYTVIKKLFANTKKYKKASDISAFFIK